MTAKVSWKEGLALLPQHFQRADEAFLEELLDAPGWPASRSWGFSRIRIDEALLSAGTVSVPEATGILPGGVRFDASEPDGKGWSRPVPETWRGDEGSLKVYLAMPCATERGCRVGPDAPFLEVRRSLADRHSGGAEREVDLLVPNVSLRFSSERLDGFAVLRLAELERAPDGSVALSRDHLPPLLDAGACPLLAQEVRRLADALAGRCRELEGREGASGPEGVRVAVEHMLLRAELPVLERLAQTPQVHPFELQGEICRILGGLSHSRGQVFRTVPYDHGDLAGCLLAPIRRAVELATGAKRPEERSFRLRRESQLFHEVRLEPDSWSGGGRFWIAVRGGLSPSQMEGAFARAAKIGPRSSLQDLIVSALPGLDLRPSAPPSTHRVQDAACFEIGSTGPLWDALVADGTLGVYAPAGLEVATMDLLVGGAHS